MVFGGRPARAWWRPFGWPRGRWERIAVGVQGALFLVLGVLFVGVAGSAGHTDRLLRDRGVSTQGTISAIGDSDDSVTITFRTLSGRPESTDDLDVPGTLVVGRRVGIVYDPDDPSRVAYAEDVVDDSNQEGDLLVGVPCLVVAGWQIVRALHRPQPPWSVRTNPPAAPTPGSTRRPSARR